jgi:AraC family transcriptional regulator of adaptative response/methylated-DNA-[protein]-cysteine methyltransferase
MAVSDKVTAENGEQGAAYNRVAAAIEYLQQHFTEQPSLEELARAANLSPFHFQRLFSEWAGVSPKKFLQYLSLDHARYLLAHDASTVLETAHATGLSGSGRLHDLFVSIEGMTPGEFRNGGASLRIDYCYADSLFGPLIAAATAKGLCYLAFEDDAATALNALQARFPNAHYRQALTPMLRQALQFFSRDWESLPQIRLHLKGTPFQLKVWEGLLSIPEGRLSTYGALASRLGQPTASRAVGTAIGSNPVAVLIPCHRVIRASGEFGGYRWGAARKAALIGWETAQLDRD